jgi:hypothetical protein
LAVTSSRFTGGVLGLLALVPLLAASALAPATPDREEIAAGEALARRRCVACHAFSPPDVLPRSSWRGVLAKMALLAAGKDLGGWEGVLPASPLIEDDRKILAYYEANAPAALATPEPWPPPDDRRLRFARATIAFPDALTPEPAVSHVQLVDLEGDGRLEVLACDMRQGTVLVGRPYEPAAGMRVVARVPHPAHVAVTDLDGDGRRDLLVADLGDFFPGDHERGALVWIRGLPDGAYAPPLTLGGFPRVADVEAADFDGDGRPDLLVGAFGWNRTGHVALLRGRSLDWARGTAERSVIDARHGAIHVLPADLDRDGVLDFVGVLAQEHEAVVAWLGDGKGGFRPRTLHAGPHPNWGSSGIQLADLDRDGDLDLLVTNGDMFDDHLLKPYHGIQWLENRGGLRYEAHFLARLAGAHRAVAADLDGDGDLDVVASALAGGASGAGLPSLVWLEQVKRGRFERRTLAVGEPRWPTLDVGDVDADGDLDVVTGRFLLAGRSDQWLDVWENQSAPRLPAAR